MPRRALIAQALLCLPCAPREAVAGAPSPVAGAVERDIVVGQSAPLGSSWGELARSYRDGVLLHFDDVNAAGGIHGRRVRLRTMDDGYVAARTVENTRRLLSDPEVVALGFYMLTNSVTPAMPMAQQAGTAFFAPYAGHVELFSRSHPFVYTLRASFSQELGAIVSQVQTIGYRRVALVGYESPSGREMVEDARARLAAIGIQIVGSGLMQINSQDATQALASLGGAQPQVLILSVSGNDAVAFLRAYFSAQSKRPLVMARSIVNGRQLQDELKADATGIVVSQIVPSPFAPITAVAQEYRRLLRARFGAAAEPDYAMFEGFIGAKVLTKAIRRCADAVSRQSLNNAIESLGVVNLGGYEIELGLQHHHGSRFVDLTMLRQSGVAR